MHVGLFIYFICSFGRSCGTLLRGLMQADKMAYEGRSPSIAKFGQKDDDLASVLDELLSHILLGP